MRKYPWPVFSPQGPSLGELARQALSSVEGGYDLLAPKFDHTPFRTSDGVLDATADALRPFGPFGRGLDVCCGTGAAMRVLKSRCQGPVTGVDFSTGMLTVARSAHPDAAWVRADVRALPFAGTFDLAVSFGALPAHRTARAVRRRLPRAAAWRAFRLPDRRATAHQLTLVLGTARIRPGHAGPQRRSAGPLRHGPVETQPQGNAGAGRRRSRRDSRLTSAPTLTRRTETLSVPALLDIAEESAALDELGDLRGDHAFP
jgi:SAM-dependent methyltransferase